MPRTPPRSPGTLPASCSKTQRRRWPTAGSLVLSDYAKGVLDENTIPALIASARAKGIPVVVDPKKAEASIFAGATLLTPNVDEMARFAGMRIGTDTEAAEAGRRVLDAVAVDAILITRGERGMTLCRRGGAPLHVAAETHRVFDVTGAGDTVVATLSAALAAGLRPRRCGPARQRGGRRRRPQAGHRDRKPGRSSSKRLASPRLQT